MQATPSTDGYNFNKAMGPHPTTQKTSNRPADLHCLVYESFACPDYPSWKSSKIIGDLGSGRISDNGLAMRNLSSLCMTLPNLDETFIPQRQHHGHLLIVAYPLPAGH